MWVVMTFGSIFELVVEGKINYVEEVMFFFQLGNIYKFY